LAAVTGIFHVPTYDFNVPVYGYEKSHNHRHIKEDQYILKASLVV